MHCFYCHNPTNNPKQFKKTLVGVVLLSVRKPHHTTTTPHQTAEAAIQKNCSGRNFTVFVAALFWAKIFHHLRPTPAPPAQNLNISLVIFLTNGPTGDCFEFCRKLQKSFGASAMHLTTHPETVFSAATVL